MKAQPLAALTVLAFTVWSCGTCAVASPLPQSKRRSKSDADINAIGHRRIVHDANFYSSEKEKELGKQLAQEVERSSKLLDDPTVMEYIERVAQNVANNSDARMPITVRVIDSETLNAFTLPGGYQYVNRGLLLRLEGEGELASVLARGIAHTALRSATRQATKGQLTQLSTIPLILMGPPGSSSSGLPLAIPLAELKMRRDEELDADYFGMQYLYKAGYDPKCFTSFVQRIWGPGAAATEKVPKVMSTYPPLDERLAALRSETSEILPPRDRAIVSTPEFDAFKERLRAQESGLELKQPSLRTRNRAIRNLL
jgi:predicted Zn-dependent protease